jgi:hypothetical protein
MTTKHYQLTFAENVYEYSGTVEAVAFKIGQTIEFDEANFKALKAGEKLTRYTREGILTLHKSQFENAVTVTEVQITTGTAKLGNRK